MAETPVYENDDLLALSGDNSLCELYAVLKTRHLLDSAFRLVGGAISASDSGLELLKRYFPMFRRYEVVI